jgi:hypothetical protein
MYLTSQYLRLYRVIQNSSTILKGVGEIIWNSKCKYSFTVSPQFPSYDVFRWCHFYYCDCRFLQTGKSIFSIVYQLSSVFAMKERILPFVAFFSHHFLDFASFFFLVIFWSCGGDLWDLLQLLLQESVNCATTVCTSQNSIQRITIRQSDISVVTWKRWRTWRRVTFIFFPSDLPNIILKYCIRALTHPV